MNPNPIVNSGRVEPLGTAPSRVRSAQDGVAAFKDVLERHLREVNELQRKADGAVRDLVTGKKDSIHEVIVAINEADLSFRLMMEIRNRLVEAYKEIMRMQV